MLHNGLTQLHYYYDFYNFCALFEIELVRYSEIDDGLSAYLCCLHIVFIDARVHVEPETAQVASGCTVSAVELEIRVYIGFAAVAS